MNERDRRSVRLVACLLLGRLGATAGLTVCLAHVLLHRPPMLWRAAAATTLGAALLAEAASLADDHRLLADELVRAVGLAALVLAAAVVRLYFVRVPHAAGAPERAAALACAAGFIGAALWLRRRERHRSPEEHDHDYVQA